MKTYPLAAEFEKLLADHERPFLALLARALRKPLNEHESLCLAYVLMTNVFSLKNESKREPFSLSEASNTLAELAGEYPESLLSAQGAEKAEELPLELRQKYWKERLEEEIAADRPKNYASQNTIMRLRDQLLNSGELSKLEFVSL